MRPAPAAALLFGLAAAALLARHTASVAVLAAGLLVVCLRAPASRRWPYLIGALGSALALFVLTPFVERLPGTVYWTGPTIPDLTQLLGTYSAEFQTAVQAQPRRRRAGVVRNPDLVVESTGHMRAFYGRAYVNSMLPSGVTAETVK